jgi:hypothetical protein
MNMRQVELSDLIGKTVVSMDIDHGRSKVSLRCSDGTEYLQYHPRHCCEEVTCEGFWGDLQRFINVPLIRVSSRATRDPLDRYKRAPGSYFLTQLCELGTERGAVVVHWRARFSNCQISWNVKIVLARVS